MDARWIEGIILVLTLLLAAMSAAAETALTALSPVALRALEEQGGVGKIIAHLREEPNRFLYTILIVSSTSLIVASSMATLLFTESLPSPWGELVATFGISILVLIFAELTPKNIAVLRPQGTAKVLARPVRWFSLALRPVILLVSVVVSVVMRLLGLHSIQEHGMTVLTEEEFRVTVDLAEETKGLTEEEAERIEGVLDLDRLDAGEVMKPRVDIVAVPVETPLMEALDVILRAGHSRIPVYEGTIDRIVGILYDKDLLRYIREEETEVSLRDVVREAIYVPESQPADVLLRDMQKRNVHMAIVLDEYGGTAGLVTIEDILEEIVGEIQDEFDVEEPLMIKESDDTWLFDAMVRIQEVNDEMEIDLAADNGVETLGGYVFERLGEVPETGDEVYVDHVVMAVVDVEGKRVKKVRITKLPPDEELEEEEAEVNEG